MLCPKCKNPIEDNASVCEWCGECLPSTNDSKNQIYGLDAEIIEIIKSGNKLKAVKVYKEKTGLGLKESKEYIDKISPNIAPKKGGCMSVIILFVIISANIFGLFQIK